MFGEQKKDNLIYSSVHQNIHQFALIQKRLEQLSCPLLILMRKM